MTASLEFHEYLWDTPVREIEGKEVQGFLLAASGAALDPDFWAHYVDGVVEAIDPPTGFPRPDPDPAVRSKRVVIPPTLRTRNPNVLQKQGSRYSGLMRRVVQCLNSRGLESPFSYSWPKTHGILEYPYPRQLGSSAGEESVAFAKRRFWIIEISSSGVYAAPITFGLQCMTCATNLTAYKSGDAVDLAWAYVNNNAGGKVLRVMDSAAIAPAYAYGGTWYAGMGWAFSWSGKSASNVVHRTVFDGDTGGLPDYYETRLNDLEFTVAFVGAAPVTLTQAAGTATALMPGHGFATGDLASISGAAVEAYNGAHVVTVLDAGSFTFAIAPATPSPAGGTPMIANASGTATITAGLTIGSPGRVTFRWNDLGTLWVPGAEQTTRWDGIRPFSNIINVSGPVHVFYDGEEKVVTTWSMASSPVAAETRLTPHPPPAPLGPLPPGADPDVYWDGVTFGFHYWLDEIEWIPIVQYNAIPNPEHPCSIKSQPTVFGAGHSYAGYTNLSWGFSGPFSIVANAYTRTRIETATTGEGLFHDAEFDWANNGGYTPCGGSGSCTATFKWEVWSRYIQKTKSVAQESLTGSAALFLLPLDREAVGGVGRTSESIATSTSGQRAYLRGAQWRQVGHATKEGCDFTQFVQDRGGGFIGPTALPSTSSSASSASKSFHLRASGGINVSGSLAGASPDFDPFIVWQAGVKETADSSVFLMRGGLEYPDPALSPANQIKNSVRQQDGVTTFSGAFAALPAGRTPVAFIGQV